MPSGTIVTAHAALPRAARARAARSERKGAVWCFWARGSPGWCMCIVSPEEHRPAEGTARARAHNVLDRFAIDFSLCMYCGICIEVCPFDALFWSPEFEYAEYDIVDMLHEKDRLGRGMQAVPPPPAHAGHAVGGRETGGARTAADDARLKA